MQKANAPDIGANDPFPFLFDGIEMAKGQKTLLINYPADRLTRDDLRTVKVNILTYDITNKEDLAIGMVTPSRYVAYIFLVRIKTL